MPVIDFVEKFNFFTYFLMILQQPTSTLFPYTTLFRSVERPQPLTRRGCAARHAARSSPRERSRSEEHTSELQSQSNLVCRLLLEKKNILFQLLIQKIASYLEHLFLDICMRRKLIVCQLLILWKNLISSLIF